MKKYVLVLIAVFAASALVPLAPLEVSAGAARVPFIRMYRADINDHFYTTSRDEASAAQKFGYRLEGEMGWLYAAESPDSLPMYRLWSSRLQNHFYTTSFAEMNQATQAGFFLEGTMGYLYKYATPGKSEKEIIRLYHPGNGDHFYTTDYVERDAAVRSGYTWEGGLGGRLLLGPEDSSASLPSGLFTLTSPAVLPSGSVGQNYSTPVRISYDGTSQQSQNYISYAVRNLPAGLGAPGGQMAGDVWITGTPTTTCSNCVAYIDVWDAVGTSATFSLYITISQSGTTVLSARDTQRVRDAITIQDAVSSYYYNQRYLGGSYNPAVVPVLPTDLSVLVPGYLQSIPTAPTPVDGACTAQQNTYAYRQVTAKSFVISFCLGAPGTYQGEFASAGYHEISLQLAD